MQRWDDLTDDQKRVARDLGREYHAANPRTLPTYAWMKLHSAEARRLEHTKLIAFGREVLSECKRLIATAGRI